MIQYKKTNWTNEEISFLKDNYKKYTYQELSEILNRSRNAIQHKISRLGFSKSQYSNQKKKLNDSFFHNINSEEKAYWLGFISADGTINNYHSGQYGFKLSLKASDDSFLKMFLKSISAKFDIVYKQIKLNNKIYKICEVSFCSKEFVTDLLQYISYNKTQNISMPHINQKFVRDYIRGFIDGDGCFYINKKNSKKKSFEMIAYNEKILLDIQQEFSNNNIVSKIYTLKNENKKLGVYANKSLIRLHHYLYDDATIYMERKYEKSLNILKLAA